MTENRKWELLEEGVRLILSGWTALRLAIENSWGGDSSRMKAQELEEDLVYWFSLNKTAPDPIKLEEQLFAALLEDFNTQVEDDSLLQVAQNMVDLYHDCNAGNTTIIEQLRSTAQSSLPQQAAMEVSSSSSSEEEGEETEMKPQHHVDEDGFTIVRHRRR